MKVRSDFVSNSSSCSFVIAINKEYDTSKFCKDLAKACSNPKSKYHNKDIVKNNQRILDFCLNTYELAFLGAWKLRTDEYVNTRESINSLYVDDDMSSDEKKLMLEEAEHHWKYELKCIEKAKDPKCDPVFKKMVERNYLDQDGKLHVFEDIYIDNCAIETDDMTYLFNRYGYASDNDKNHAKIRIENLKKLAKEEADHEHGKTIARRHVKCYAITMNTVKNTRDLIAAGMDITLEKYEDLDKLQKRLEAGEKIFAIHIGHDGEGYGNYEIYREDGASGLDNLPVEILDSEPM